MKRALAGEPQRVTRHDKEAVVIVSEQEWRARSRSAPTLGALLARYARAGTIREDVVDRPWRERPLGTDLGRRCPARYQHRLDARSEAARDPFVELPEDA